MSNIQRLKFAFARGARIQFNYRGVWQEARSPLWNQEINFRIHPKDEHLQYGLLSNAMRAAGLDGVAGITSLAADAYQMYQHIVGGSHPTRYVEDYDGADPKTVGRLHALFIAELLADEGL